MLRMTRDKPWIFRTYAGHSTAADSNALYRRNLAKGQTGLSVAFDLPTQTGYDSDHVLARGEVGKVGVPISHVGDMRALFDQIPLDSMNTSMSLVMSEANLEAVERLRPIAAGEGISLAELALAWVLRREEVAAAIVGASRPEQVYANAAASGVELSGDVLAAIDAALGDAPVVEPRLAPLAQAGVKRRT